MCMGAGLGKQIVAIFCSLLIMWFKPQIFFVCVHVSMWLWRTAGILQSLALNKKEIAR